MSARVELLPSASRSIPKLAFRSVSKLYAGSGWGQQPTLALDNLDLDEGVLKNG